MRTLKLTLTKKWFALVLSGEKKEEYREIKKHWVQRFVTQKYTLQDYQRHGVIDSITGNAEYYSENKMEQFDFVEFTNGYSKNSPKVTIECLGITISPGKTEHGAIEGNRYFTIKLGKEISRFNC